MTLLAVVPAPASFQVRESAPFHLTADTAITGETDAAAALAALVAARTGWNPPVVERARNERDETPRTTSAFRLASSLNDRKPPVAEDTSPNLPVVERARNERDETPRTTSAFRLASSLNDREASRPASSLDEREAFRLARSLDDREASPLARSLDDREESAGAPIELRVVPDAARPESYTLTVDAASVIVTGADAAGLFYGVQTLGQLIARDSAPGHDGDRWIVPAVEIRDAPRFAYRGVMLDVARHFFPVEAVKRYLDRAASLKFNHLHLHLSDDQGWRIQLDSRPRLTALASGTAVGGDDGGFFTKADYRELVAYAAARHVVIVPEIDLPGHTHAVGLAYPELVEAPAIGDELRAQGGTMPETGEPYEGVAVGFSSLRIRDEATFDFVADVFGELAGLTPGPYLHFGGDEAHGTDPDDFAEFVSRTSQLIADLGKIPVAWHEAGAARDLSDTTIGQYWGFVTPSDGADDLARAFVALGSRLILSPADAIYLDMQHPDLPGLGLTWANGPTSVRRAYSWEPSDVIAGIDESDLLGIEAPMWTETNRTLEDLDTMAFPRIAAAAEAAWSPATGVSELRTWESFRERVGALGPLWTSLGIRFHRTGEIPWAVE